jgi:integrase
MSRLKKRGKRLYGDFRDYADVGGGYEALKPEGEVRATTDPDEGTALLAARLKELKELRRQGYSPGDSRDPRLEDYSRYHLAQKAHARRAVTVESDERRLRMWLDYFRDHLNLPNIRLSQVTVERVTRFLNWSRQQPGRNGNTKSGQTLQHELHALSNLFRRAVREGKARENPVARLLDRPRIDREEATYLEPGEAARLLKAAQNLDAKGHHLATPFLHPLLATYLYTGGSPVEPLGLEVQDIDFDNGVVHFRPNRWRSLKRKWRKRLVPLWPDLRAVLAAHIGEREQGLLFPSKDGKMLTDWRARLETAVKAAKIEKHVTPYTLRHTYTAARLQTLDNGQPVSPWTVACELGHRDVNLIQRTYGHLLKTRHRSDSVEYREAKVLEHKRRAKTG